MCVSRKVLKAHQGMNMRIKCDEIAECLHVEDEGGLATRLQGVEAGLEESRDQPAKREYTGGLCRSPQSRKRSRISSRD